MTEPTRGEWPAEWSAEMWAARPARIIPVPNLTASTVLFAGRGILHGWSFFVVGATSLSYILYDGTDANGTLITEGTVTTATTDRQSLGTAGVELTQGLFLAISAGQANGSVWAAYDDARDRRRHDAARRPRVAGPIDLS